MEVARYKRLGPLAKGNPQAWAIVMERYLDRELNPTLSLAHYTSSLSRAELLAIHDRKKEGMKEKVIYERKL